MKPLTSKVYSDSSRIKSVRVVFLVPDTPTKYPLQPDSFLKIAQRVVRSYGVHNNAFMDRQMDGWTDGFHANSYIP